CTKMPLISLIAARNAYHSLDTKLQYINPDIVPLSEVQLQRQRRAVPVAPADAVPAAASSPQQIQYQSGAANATATRSGASASASATAAATAEVDAGVKSADSKVSGTYNVQNVGVDGAGQRKDYNVTSSGSGSNVTSINVAAAVPLKKTQLMASAQASQYPKKVAATSSVQVPAVAGSAPGSSSTTTTTTERALFDDVDVSDEVIAKETANQSLTRREDHFDYYRSLFYVSADETSQLWAQQRLLPENNMLSSSHRRAMTVELKFDFPFYGHYVRNITVATGGFLYTGEYVHSWLAATQYIAPLMANFDSSTTSDSFVRLQDNGTAFTVVWENVTLQDKPEYGKFTFSVSLHQNGDIVFVYYQLPTLINNIQDSQHPVKVGLSDAYIVDKKLLFAHRKTIYEYHRVTFGQQEITNSTIIILTALPTCLGYNDCESCIKHNTTFDVGSDKFRNYRSLQFIEINSLLQCAWCPAVNRCSTHNGNDRRKQEWQQKGCERTLITTSDHCPAIGQKGNNAAQDNNGGSSNRNNANAGGGGGSGAGLVPSSTSATNSAAGSAGVTEPTVVASKSPPLSAAAASSDGHKVEKSEHLDAPMNDNKNVGVAFGFMVPICLVFAVTLWLFYAYRNPHTRSGQLLIQFRPSQWSWRRGEARYTAATIHM
ncbi:hypothetical protein KR222_010771, partial [Zaprionus bogoriensis]